ncbi:glycosyl hydrolase family 10 [Breznakibacter xylanolyticus]|uniref:endo-1,4-beta-xylanase n=1 Tax=Breznakibacter xylanolyticus TaxID=990 RepID=A0A2W7MUQ0_9BACT|nr:endo-1,4-beta-xylanase [Breznakibacter xylanolyticus]PZX11865.1 glycosyl hydrolase family 10 [Breznakibacter xylanolyticus]
MKLRFLFLAFAAYGTMTSGAQNYTTFNPANETNYGYLKNYLPLKQYVNHVQYPNFKLGLAVSANDYLNNNTVKAVVNGYFTETVAGNEMKMSSCVSSNGAMNFTTVTNFVNAASTAGVHVFGHTLAWHSQQPTGYLNGLIKDKDPVPFADSDITVWTLLKSKDFTQDKSIGWTSNKTTYGFSTSFVTDGLQVNTTKKTTNTYDVQYIVMDNIPTVTGVTYQMTITVKGSAAGNIHSKLGNWSGGANAEIPFTTEWQDVVINYTSTIDNSFLLFQHGDFVGDIWIKNIRFDKSVGGKKATRSCIVMDATAKNANTWDNQFWIKLGSFNAGDTYEFSAEVRADNVAKASTQTHNAPGSYVTYQAIGDVNFTTDWKTVTKTGSFTNAGQSIAFNLNEFSGANKYCFDNISFKVNGVERVTNGNLDGTDVSSFAWRHYGDASVASATITANYNYVILPQSIPLSDQEKHDILVDAMDRWIAGMMNACGGKVKAWDVVNEAISGSDSDGDGFYDLQHENGDDANFFWQDHMGDLEYTRQAVRLARLHYANSMASKGGDDGQLTLFINDYNLESDWDGNKKLKSLIKWIERWEEDGVTTIDGIGSQMHISCYMNDATQTSKKNAIENSFKLMAATGKLVRISELDMGMVDASGNDVATANVTEEMHQRMADLYEWIIKKYFEIVPANQQWGICQWCATDAPTNSGWRADLPVGLWTLDWYRKHTYAGFARGLGAPQNPTSVDRIIIDSNNQAPAPIYDLYGRNLGNDLEILPAGIYIQNGKKFLMR